MPKLKKTEEEQKNNLFKATYHYHKQLMGYSNFEIYNSIGLKETTFYARLKNPSRFTVDDIRRLVKFLHIKDEDVLKMI